MLKNNYRIDILTDELRRIKLDLLGVSETHILGIGRMTLSDLEFFYSGKKDGVHKTGSRAPR